MQAKKLFNTYQDYVKEDLKEYKENYERVFQEVEDSPAKYKGKPVEFLYQPMFFTDVEIDRFRELTDQLMVILNKVIDEYIQNPAFRKHFGFSPLLEKMILKDPGYDVNVPMGRFDIFYHYDTGDFQFCELNADGSSGMIEQRELQKIIEKSKAIEDFSGQYQVEGFELFDSWVEALLKNYKEYSKKDVKPQVAIVDFFKAEPPSEFIEFQKAFEAKGCPTIVVDPRNLEYRDGNLFYQNFRIDCVYRRTVTWEIIEHAEEVKAYIDAYLDGNVCFVGPIRSQVIHNKAVFAILHDKEKTPFLTPEERTFVERHIPYTSFFDNQNQGVVAYALENKDKLVLKPMDRYASNGVKIGEDYSLEEWKKIIEEEAVEEYLLQAFCKVPKAPMARFDREDVKFIDHNYIIGLFMYNGKMQGVYTRTGTHNIIGSIVECFTVPNFLFRKK
ncbi:glutathionylspermidine synthase family protein [Alkaliphilus transvaalensis]|uniref:glutathionylspermidine synthase family protein n=1 Tax=Alkaliphilus transvaalensis TaxID=114628 RepID=UPI00047B8919|nr:glutathionylspermidine synthase family protein [Alkaliphilus transvaalensis]